jgi:predicted lipoprotein with Yx(FWY)xxD motif
MLQRIRVAPTVIAGGAVIASLAALAPFSALAGPRASGPALARATAAARIELRSTSLGKLLTNSAGLTLFVFSKDSRNVDRCAPVASCANVWSIISTRGTPTVGLGVKRSLLGTIHVRGRTQVTYAGHPLYRYAPEPTPGATDYVGAHASGGVWRAIRASGALVG